MSDKFIGMPYPITRDPKGYYRKQSGSNQVKSDLLCLLLTNPGERVMLPDFGCDLRGLVFQQNDEATALIARERIIAAISTWEPRIAVEQIDVITNVNRNKLSKQDDLTNANHVLMIRIRFVDPENIQEVQELRVELPINATG